MFKHLVSVQPELCVTFELSDLYRLWTAQGARLNLDEKFKQVAAQSVKEQVGE